jgi:Mrp family chromosome partitioning ATPase
VVTAGRPDPDPLGGLSSERMRLFVREAAESFDWVIIDSPPVLLMPDAGLVASMVDAVVFVIAAGSTPHNSIQRAVEMIGRGRIIGVVLNKVDKGVMDAGGQYETYYAQYASPRKTT